MSEQRNPYMGSPARPRLRLVLVAADGTQRQVEALADTGNPCALIVGQEVMDQFNQGLVPGMSTNFGRLAGGWLRVQIPEVEFDANLIAYASDAVAQAAAESHPSFQALAGLPLLRMMEYGGNGDGFWVRKP
jgi:hypothetical protein